VFGQTVMVSGCWFHYDQALMKRSKKIGLTNAYRNEENIAYWPLLPSADIDHAFKDVTVMVTEDSPSKTQMEQLCCSVHKQWLKTASGRRGCRYETIAYFAH